LSMVFINYLAEELNSTYSTGQVLLPVLFLFFLLRIKSFNELDFMIKNHEFSKLFSRGTNCNKVDAIYLAYICLKKCEGNFYYLRFKKKRLRLANP